MTFWLEREWQVLAARRVATTLDGVNDELLPQKLTSGAWTKPMFAKLAPAALELCGEYALRSACSFGGGQSQMYRKGWLYDFCCWIMDPEQRLWGLPIVIESEWKAWSEVLDDFEKLLQARAGLRVLVFQHDSSTPIEWEADLITRTRTFAESVATDAWLFSLWRDGRFHHRSNLWE